MSRLVSRDGTNSRRYDYAHRSIHRAGFILKDIQPGLCGFNAP
jgi:hypothetical protein